MSEENSPKRLPCRVHSTFEIANPITELPPEEFGSESPEPAHRKLTVDEVLSNAVCEDGVSMDQIATYIPSKAVRKQMAEQAAKIAAEAAAKVARLAKIAELEAEIAALKREALEDGSDSSFSLEKLSITRPTSVIAHGVALASSATAGVASAVLGAQSPISPQGIVSSSARGSVSSNNAVFVTPPAIGALVAAPPAMGALMGASPAIGALVVAALQPAAQGFIGTDDANDGHFGDDFQLIHNEYKEAIAHDKAAKKNY